MKILTSIFCLLVLMILTSKVKINIKYLNRDKKTLKIDFDVNGGIYFLGFIKVSGVSLKKDGIHFLFFTIPYKKIKMNKNAMKFSILGKLKNLDLKIEKLNLDMHLGTEDVIFTAFLVFVISTFLGIVLAKNNKQISEKNYYYNITPVYNRNILDFNFSAKFSTKLINIIKIIIQKNSQNQTYTHSKKEALKI